MICKNTWSEPEKTRYLDVTTITTRTKNVDEKINSFDKKIAKYFGAIWTE